MLSNGNVMFKKLKNGNFFCGIKPKEETDEAEDDE